MGNYCCQEKIVRRQKISLLLIGLDNAGKTVTAKGLAGETVDCPIPTIGFSVINLRYLNYDVKIFDLGGHRTIRGIWNKYFVDVHGVIFVIDSCDLARFGEVKEVLEEILSSEKISGKPLLILANKQDKECALDEIDLIECLDIEMLANRYRCPTLVQSCSANETNYNKPDPGIMEGYQWLVNYIDKNYDKLNIRVQIDIIDQNLKEKEELLAKIQRINVEREIKKNQDTDRIETYSEYVAKLNGDAGKELDVDDLYSNPEESSHSTTNSTDSSIIFPAIYHINSPTVDRERPKSAIQIVRHQLQMSNEVKRSQSAKTRRNKTAPVKIFEAKEFMPQSAKERNTQNIIVKPQRAVKTADERIFTISKSHMGPAGDYYTPAVTREVFEIEGRFDVKKLPPLKVKSKAQINHEGDVNGICVIDVE